ncbi:uncharacterized protein LOC117334130 [Pecten maximus]|uniref:uncharacterized protein LOC117334130 n=1 Tax=Pecten maximus TaxID=6579 RepID=UPI001457EA6B|nr:uncharacterized protein LOC117334130 [Pecten maximus]
MMISIWLVYVIFALVLNMVISDDDVTILNNVKYVHGFKLRTGVFRVFDNSSYTGCVRECLLRRHCLAITYHLTGLYCHLGSQANDLERVSDNKMISSHPTEWDPPKGMVGNCSEKPCGVGERCTRLSSGNIVCVNTECIDPPGKSFTTTSSLREIGITISYELFTNFTFKPVISGNPNITCKTNGTWTSSDFTVKLLPECPSDFQMVADTYCILLVTDKRLNPVKGETYCQTKGSRLIWMTSVDKFDAIVSVIETGRYFLAGTDTEVEGTWRLPDGEHMTWLHSRAERIDTKNEDCLTYDDRYGKLRDYPCTASQLFICEIP